MATLGDRFSTFLKNIRPTDSQRAEMESGHKTLRSNLNEDEDLQPILVADFPPAESSLRPVQELLDTATLHHRFGSPSPEPGESLYSGRILCRLETEGPVVIGSEQDQPPSGEDRETVVHPFELPDPRPVAMGKGRPAIPGSSLRGLVSSLVEAASSSAMRVLGDATYTRRALVGKGAQEGLSAIGMLVGDGEVRRLRPLSMSLQEMKNWKGAPPRHGCRVLVGRYRKGQDRLEPLSDSFLAKDPKSWSASHQEYWYCDLEGAEWHPEAGLPIGIYPKDRPISAREWEALEEPKRKLYTRGVLLVVGLDGSKAKNLPDNKRFEFFLPYPAGKDGDERATLEVDRGALDELRELAHNSASLPRGGKDQDFPYLHRGRVRDRGGFEPQHGDLVYYEETAPGSGVVGRLALTAIWRRPVPGGGVWDSVRGRSHELVPFHAGRSRLTLAERLFGFVEQQDRRRPRDGGRAPSLALAGRVRFAHGLVIGEKPEEGWYEAEASLKILASPKPPSSALYFGNHKSAGEKALAKNELHLGTHVPQGRKVYLHHRDQDLKDRCYETREPERNRKLKLRVRPLRRGTAFFFHIDFHNLERVELGHLLYALRPTPEYRHKVGLGKPIGLGRVCIDPLAVAHVHRAERYRPDGLLGPRFQAVEWLQRPTGWDDRDEHLRARYGSEWEAGGERIGGDGGFPQAAGLAEETRGGIHPEIRAAIELVGDPAQVDLPVTYPVLADQGSESEHFRWFVENDARHRQRLEPLVAGNPLPVLTRHPQPAKKGGRKGR